MSNSDVFRAMFNHEDTKEFIESRIQIEDSTATAVRQMINYIYKKKVPEDYAVEKDAVALLNIAHKYQIKPLMEYNERKLVKRLKCSML
jgi:acetamidase/formamidase